VPAGNAPCVIVKGCVAAVTPVPDIVTEGDAEALVASDTLPASVPALEGVKLTVSAVEPPAATVAGMFIPDTV
jgi:hypothetical protein